MSNLFINPGFIGYAQLGSLKIRCNSYSVNVKQEPLFYDHTIGLRDSIPSSVYAVKADIAAYNKQKIIWRPGVKISQGSFSFPWTDKTIGTLFEEAKKGDSFDFDFYYTCGLGRTIERCKANSYNLKISNGEVVEATVDIMACHMEENNTDPLLRHIDKEKLVTWDATKVSINGAELEDLVFFELTINNGCMPIYTSGNNNNENDPLEPSVIRVGMQMVTGTLAYYNKNDLAFLEDENSSTKIKIEVGTWTETLNVIFRPMEATSSVGAVVRTVGFVGVDNAIDP